MPLISSAMAGVTLGVEYLPFWLVRWASRACHGPSPPPMFRGGCRVLAILAREAVLGGRLGHAMDPARRPCFEEATSTRGPGPTGSSAPPSSFRTRRRFTVAKLVPLLDLVASVMICFHVELGSAATAAA
eukprot:CAMPEP_0181281484 /NCGR_PEP_ID=MMETSP1097-20121128/13610_1 /TAXON_ID=35684 /ORGANISM="Pseudopedinella elastica, Strain CCMP716" /LENGTH=129 /DNA_ID=CAMNT_0023384285 /DNA_START=455 /DNA_END=841 /DNA_ORIENTATION=-